MLKVFLKTRLLPLSIGLLIASAPALAGYSDDADCKVVSDSAKASANRDSARLDTVAKETSSAIKTAKSCVDQVLDGANRAIPNFGGAGAIGSIANQLGLNLANQACQLISTSSSTAQASVINSASSAAQPYTSQVPASVMNAVETGISQSGSTSGSPSGSPSASGSSVWQRLGNIF